MAEIFAVIVAGGQGTRMGSAVPKQFLSLNGKPVLHHTINAFITALPSIQIVLVLPEQQISYAQMVLESFPERIDLSIVAGGTTRFESVANGLSGIPEDAVVFVQDGVRPLITPDLIRRCYDQAVEKGSAIPCIPVADSVRIVKNEESQPLDRSKLRIIQTPQTFKASILLQAMRQPFQESFTDEATVVESYGQQVYLIEGEKSNIKITTPEDMLIAEAFIRAREQV